MTELVSHRFFARPARAYGATFAFALLLNACASGIVTPPAPRRFGPVTRAQVDGWVAATRPPRYQRLRFSWRFNDRRETVKGKGSAWIAPPDSLRFDFTGPLGFARGAVAVIGDSALWVEGVDQVDRLVPNYPLLWAMLGVARPASPGFVAEGSDDGRSTSWRYVSGADTVEYRRVSGAKAVLMALVTTDGKQLGRVLTQFDSLGRPARSQLQVFGQRSTLDITFTLAARSDTLPKDTWIAPHNQ